MQSSYILSCFALSASWTAKLFNFFYFLSTFHAILLKNSFSSVQFCAQPALFSLRMIRQLIRLVWRALSPQSTLSSCISSSDRTSDSKKSFSFLKKESRIIFCFRQSWLSNSFSSSSLISSQVKEITNLWMPRNFLPSWIRLLHSIWASTRFSRLSTSLRVSPSWYERVKNVSRTHYLLSLRVRAS